MSKSIKLSPKHGVNPTIPVCFWCGESKQEIALLGRIDRADSEAPMHVVLDYEPCDKCAEAFSKGIQLIGVKRHQVIEGFPPINSSNGVDVYPTGSFAVMTKEAFKRNFTGTEESLQEIIKCGKVLMDNEIVEEIINDSEKGEQNNESN